MATPSEVRDVETLSAFGLTDRALEHTGSDETKCDGPINAAPRAEKLYVIGGAPAVPMTNGAVHAFPLVVRKPDEDESSHAWRFALRVERAIQNGATHLLIPTEHVDWFNSNPTMVDYLANSHEVVASSLDTGILISLRASDPVSFDARVTGWQIAVDDGVSLYAASELVEPTLILTPTRPVLGRLRGCLHFAAQNLSTLRISFVLARPALPWSNRRHLYLSLARPGFLLHDLPFVSATFDASAGRVRLDFDLELLGDKPLRQIELAPIEEDNWRMHPAFPGGKSFKLPDIAPAGARLELHDIAVTPTQEIRNGSPHGVVLGDRPIAYRKPPGKLRDAVIFSSWVPDEGLVLGDYFIETLKRWHGDSKIFVGINHGSSSEWRVRLEGSGLDLTIQEASPAHTMPFDPTGFIAALDAFRHHDEPFDLVWFGHNKGGSHLDRANYGTGRWTIERMFWSRREEIERHFADPVIGLYTPHYLMMLQEHMTQAVALQRMYAAPCKPLCAMAVSAHYVMRNASVREFCEHVDRRLFTYGVEPFGGDRFFFEMAMPNVPIMQGYEPYIEPGLGGTSGQPKMDGIESILNDWRQNNAVTAIELAKWRQDPTRFRTKHHEHNRCS